MAGLWGLGNALQIPVGPRIFVSYHHAGDQRYYNEFSRIFHDSYESIYDNSLERQIESDDVDYTRWRIRDEYIRGTSCTVVLCGADTWKRKYVDWEVKATLDMQHGLIAINLPSNPIDPVIGKYTVPDRLHENIQSGYAVWQQWTDLSVANLRLWLAEATNRSSRMICNTAHLLQQNRA